MQEIRMAYRAYKQHYSDCETKPGSYWPTVKSIIVFVPDGRQVKSGVRGRHFGYYTFHGIELATGRAVETTVKAVDAEHARARLARDCVWSA